MKKMKKNMIFVLKSEALQRKIIQEVKVRIQKNVMFGIGEWKKTKNEIKTLN
jgi:hypothetical protein